MAMGHATTQDRSVCSVLAGLVACILASTGGLPAFAQLPTGRILAPPAGSPIQRLTPPALPSAAPGIEVPLLPPAGTEVPNRPVRVISTEMEGVTAFKPAVLLPYADGLIGSATLLPKIDAARQKILQHYRSQGFVLTTVSVKLDGPGHLRFVVTEGRIAAVKLDGDIGPAGTRVLRYLERLTQVAPIDSLTLERYLLLAQDVPGVTLRAVLQPSTDEPGAMTLVAQVSRKALSGSFSADNRAFDQIGPNAVLGVLDFNSFTSFGERTEVSFYHTFPNSQNFGQVSQEFLIGSSGLKLKAYAGYGKVAPEATTALGKNNYHGTTTVFGTQVSYPVIRSRQQTLNVFGTFEGIESEIRTGNPQSRASFDSLRVLRIGEEYVLSDILLGAERSAFNTAQVRISEGLRILGASTTGTAQLSARQHERSDFTKVNFEFTRNQTLFSPWGGATVGLFGLVTGQWSDDILPPAEQFYLGGSRFTRGYYAGQVPGDKALAATAELQLNTSFNVPSVRDDADIATQFYVFYDWGETWQNVSADQKAVVTSAGGGARIQITSYAEIDVEALGRFNLYPTGGQGTGVQAINGIGLYWRLLGRF
jgi:hemolysin activation/secretion protein